MEIKLKYYINQFKIYALDNAENIIPNDVSFFSRSITILLIFLLYYV